jgi:hypothetical protein
VPPALVDAAAAGFEKVLEILLDQGADIEICWRDLGTALMAACSHGRLRAVQLLVSRAPQLSFLGSDGRTFDAIGQAKNHPDIVKWLKEIVTDRGYPNSAAINQGRTDVHSECSRQLSVKSLLRRRNSCSLVHERWTEVQFWNAHRKDKPHFEDKQWWPSTGEESNVHEPRWAKGHRLAKHIFRASDSRASGSTPCDAWMIF